MGPDNPNLGRFRGGAAVDCDGRKVHINEEVEESDGGSQLAGWFERQQLVGVARIMPKFVGASCSVPQQVHFSLISLNGECVDRHPEIVKKIASAIDRICVSWQRIGQWCRWKNKSSKGRSQEK